MVVRRNKMKPTLTINLSPELKVTLETISHAEHKSINDLIQESIRRYIAVYQFRNLRKKVLPFAQAQGVSTDQDVFKILE
jgi:predicted transcriptional regulator